MGLGINNYVNNIEYETSSLKGIITVEHRSNNPKRDFLFCNRIQGKHIPTRPSSAINLFRQLADKIYKKTSNKKVLVIGFAETATAIGATVADWLPNSVYYIQTTREKCNCGRLIEFQEEHSHATEQYLCGNWESIPYYDYVLFIDDEISTGKTVLNFINEFKKVNNKVTFGVGSICNWQTEDNINKYNELGIDIFALIKGSVKDINGKMDVTVRDLNKVEESKITDSLSAINCEDIFDLERTGRIPRGSKYNKDILSVVRAVLKDIEGKVDKESKILVLGTEEFMYVPIQVGLVLENHGYNVFTHSNSRSSIDIINESTEDGICKKYKIPSAYDINRTTYIYNLDKYDKVIILTDSKNEEAIHKFNIEIRNALTASGNRQEDIVTYSIK